MEEVKKEMKKQKENEKQESETAIPDYLKVKSVHIFGWPFLLNKDQSVEKMKESLLQKGWKHKQMDYRQLECGSRESKESFMLEQYLSTAAKSVFLDRKADICTVYEYPLPTDGQYEYYIKTAKRGSYHLPIDAIELHLYYYGVGILFFRTYNKDMGIKDILLINDKGRRVAMPFLPDSPDVSKKEGYMLCPESIGIHYKTQQSVTDFRDMVTEYYDTKLKSVAGLSEHATFLDDIINGNLGRKKENDIHVVPTTDDRMFVLSLIRDDKLSAMIAKEEERNREENSKLIYSIIHADESLPSCQSKEMRKELFAKSLYRRWEDWGTLFGITGYSFICITSEDEEVNSSVVRPFVVEYQYLLSLVYAQKMGVYDFAMQAGHLVEGVEKDGRIQTKKAQELIELQERYVTFKNQVLVLEASCQEQGIELYQMMQRQLLVEEEEEVLDKQLESLYEIVNTFNGTRIGKQGIFWAIIAIGVSIAISLIDKLFG